MKKVIAFVLVSIMCVAMLAACGGGGGESANKYNIDYDSTETQDMSAEKADQATLSDVVQNWLGGYTMFMPGQEQGEYTYEDFVKKIGVDATTYNKDDSGRRVYTWVASDNETAKLAAYFDDNGGKWQLTIAGSSNLA